MSLVLDSFPSSVSSISSTSLTSPVDDPSALFVWRHSVETLRQRADSMTIKDFLTQYECDLPAVIMVTGNKASQHRVTRNYQSEQEAISPRDETVQSVEQLAIGSVYLIVAVGAQKRVVAQTDDDQYLSMPLNYPATFQCVNADNFTISDPVLLTDIVTDGLSVQRRVRMTRDARLTNQPLKRRSRDSKEMPANLLSTGNGYLQILDFYEEKYLLGYHIFSAETLGSELVIIPGYFSLTLDVAVDVTATGSTSSDDCISTLTSLNEAALKSTSASVTSLTTRTSKALSRANVGLKSTIYSEYLQRMNHIVSTSDRDYSINNLDDIIVFVEPPDGDYDVIDTSRYLPSVSDEDEEEESSAKVHSMSSNSADSRIHRVSNAQLSANNDTLREKTARASEVVAEKSADVSRRRSSNSGSSSGNSSRSTGSKKHHWFQRPGKQRHHLDDRRPSAPDLSNVGNISKDISWQRKLQRQRTVDGSEAPMLPPRPDRMFTKWNHSSTFHHSINSSATSPLTLQNSFSPPIKSNAMPLINSPERYDAVLVDSSITPPIIPPRKTSGAGNHNNNSFWRWLGSSSSSRVSGSTSSSNRNSNVDDPVAISRDTLAHPPLTAKRSLPADDLVTSSSCSDVRSNLIDARSSGNCQSLDSLTTGIENQTSNRITHTMRNNQNTSNGTNYTAAPIDNKSYLAERRPLPSLPSEVELLNATDSHCGVPKNPSRLGTGNKDEEYASCESFGNGRNVAAMAAGSFIKVSGDSDNNYDVPAHQFKNGSGISPGESPNQNSTAGLSELDLYDTPRNYTSKAVGRESRSVVTTTKTDVNILFTPLSSRRGFSEQPLRKSPLVLDRYKDEELQERAQQTMKVSTLHRRSAPIGNQTDRNIDDNEDENTVSKASNDCDNKFPPLPDNSSGDKVESVSRKDSSSDVTSRPQGGKCRISPRNSITLKPLDPRRRVTIEPTRRRSQLGRGAERQPGARGGKTRVYDVQARATENARSSAYDTLKATRVIDGANGRNSTYDVADSIPGYYDVKVRSSSSTDDSDDTDDSGDYEEILSPLVRQMHDSRAKHATQIASLAGGVAADGFTRAETAAVLPTGLADKAATKHLPDSTGPFYTAPIPKGQRAVDSIKSGNKMPDPAAIATNLTEIVADKISPQPIYETYEGSSKLFYENQTYYDAPEKHHSKNTNLNSHQDNYDLYEELGSPHPQTPSSHTAASSYKYEATSSRTERIVSRFQTTQKLRVNSNLYRSASSDDILENCGRSELLMSVQKTGSTDVLSISDVLMDDQCPGYADMSMISNRFQSGSYNRLVKSSIETTQPRGSRFAMYQTKREGFAPHRDLTKPSVPSHADSRAHVTEVSPAKNGQSELHSHSLTQPSVVIVDERSKVKSFARPSTTVRPFKPDGESGAGEVNGIRSSDRINVRQIPLRLPDTAAPRSAQASNHTPPAQLPAGVEWSVINKRCPVNNVDGASQRSVSLTSSVRPATSSPSSTMLSSVWQSINDVPLDISSLTVDEVTHCLCLLNLSQYVAVFREQMIDGCLLACLDEATLQHDFNFKRFDSIKLVKFARDGWRPRFEDNNTSITSSRL